MVAERQKKEVLSHICLVWQHEETRRFSCLFGGCKRGVCRTLSRVKRALSLPGSQSAFAGTWVLLPQQAGPDPQVLPAWCSMILHPTNTPGQESEVESPRQHFWLGRH